LKNLHKTSIRHQPLGVNSDVIVVSSTVLALKPVPYVEDGNAENQKCNTVIVYR